jgi:hypothetical protein
MILTIIGLVIGLVGIIPLFFDLKKYQRVLNIRFSKDDLIIENAIVTFDVKKIDKLNIFITSKYKVLKDDPTLILPFTNRFGNVENFLFYIDNKKISPVQSNDGDHIVYKYKITNKEIGESFNIEAICSMDCDSGSIDKENDGLAYWLDYYKCKYLKLLVIFPPKFTPYNVSFAERPADFSDSKEVKEQFGNKSPFSSADNRKALEWSIEYPKFMKAYRIGWSWNA